MFEVTQQEDTTVHDGDMDSENCQTIFDDNNVIEQKELGYMIPEYQPDLIDMLENDAPQVEVANKHSQTNPYAIFYAEKANMNSYPSTDQTDSSGQMESQWSFMNHDIDHSQVSNLGRVEQNYYVSQTSPQHNLVNHQSKSSLNSQKGSNIAIIENLSADENLSESADQNLSENISESHQEPKKNQPDSTNSRRPKGYVSKLRQEMGGQFETKYLLPAAKKIHFDYIIKIKGQDFIEQHPELKSILDHKGIAKRHFKILYKLKYLKTQWKQFFRRKFLYQGLMLSKVSPKRKKSYVKYLESFEYAYLTREFTSLTKVRTKELRVLKAREQSLQRENHSEQPSSIENQ